MRQFWTISLLLVVPLFFLWGCDNDTSNGNIEGEAPVVTDLTCVGCHTSRDMLQEALADMGVVMRVPNKDDG